MTEKHLACSAFIRRSVGRVSETDIKKTDRQECPQTKQPFSLLCEDFCVSSCRGLFPLTSGTHKRGSKECVIVKRVREGVLNLKCVFVFVCGCVSMS